MKYVCVGQPKTGTKTMAEIFRLLMFNVNNNPICSCSDANDEFILLDNNIEYYINDIFIDQFLGDGVSNTGDITTSAGNTYKFVGTAG